MDEPNSIDEVKVILRLLREDDLACIYSTWRNSAYFGMEKKERNADRFFKKQTAIISQTLSDALVRIACLEEDPNMIIGYAVSTGDHLDWIYVKVEYRNKGIGTMLFPKNIKTVTPRQTKIGSVITKKKKLNIKENISEQSKTSEGTTDIH